MVLGTLLYIIIIIIALIIIVVLLQAFIGVFAVLNLDSDLMNIYPDPGQPITILEDKQTGITTAFK